MADICTLCPRRCGVDRSGDKLGFCAVPQTLKVARAALHFWEEPCISGTRGSGTVFFSGCTLRCVFCQNREISRGQAGKLITVDRLCEIFLELQAKGAHNINLVTPDHYAKEIAEALTLAKGQGLGIPIVVNTSGYMSDEVLDILAPNTDIWLTDFKYFSSDLAARYSSARDYVDVTKNALQRMFAAAGKPRFDEEGIMQSGVIVRLLLLPGQVEDTKRIVKYIYENYDEDVLLSLMSQYTPPKAGLEAYPELMRTVSEEEYDELCDFALDLGIEQAFVQEGGAADESFIPPFNLEGV